ncbi:hypothetical protein NQZ68_003888 [Dissostichus eleginoides]|nr:hypothetical protein NQZ68_003888 [Dissostichus eleginoides]
MGLYSELYECLGCIGSEFFFLELRVLVAAFQRDVTSSGVTLGNGLVLEGLTAIHHSLVPWDPLWLSSQH